MPPTVRYAERHFIQYKYSTVMMMYNPSKFHFLNMTSTDYITVVPLHKDFITPRKDECTYSIFSCEDTKVLPRSEQFVKTGLRIRFEGNKNICAHIFGGGELKSVGLLVEPQLFDKAKEEGSVFV